MDLDLANLQHHSFAHVFPMYKEKELKELAADIALNGMIEKIILLGGYILDGRNRYAALKLLGVELEYDWHFTDFQGTEDEALRVVTALNLRRRHLSNAQKAMAASTIATFENGGRRDAQVKGVTNAQAGAALGISEFMVLKARGIRRTAAPAIVAMCERGEVTIAAAELVATLPAARQAKLTTPAAVTAAAAKIRALKRTFAAYTPRRVVEIAGDLGEELAERGIDAFAREAEPGSIARIDSTLGLLGELRAAIVATHGAAVSQGQA